MLCSRWFVCGQAAAIHEDHKEVKEQLPCQIRVHTNTPTPLPERNWWLKSIYLSVFNSTRCCVSVAKTDTIKYCQLKNIKKRPMLHTYHTAANFRKKLQGHLVYIPLAPSPGTVQCTIQLLVPFPGSNQTGNENRPLGQSRICAGQEFQDCPDVPGRLATMLLAHVLCECLGGERNGEVT